MALALTLYRVNAHRGNDRSCTFRHNYNNKLRLQTRAGYRSLRDRQPRRHEMRDASSPLFYPTAAVLDVSTPSMCRTSEGSPNRGLCASLDRSSSARPNAADLSPFRSSLACLAALLAPCCLPNHVRSSQAPTRSESSEVQLAPSPGASRPLEQPPRLSRRTRTRARWWW